MLQGAVTHSAFTSHVLDRFLSEPRLASEVSSATNAGAMNAVMRAPGLAQGNLDGARRALARFRRHTDSRCGDRAAPVAAKKTYCATVRPSRSQERKRRP